MPKDRVLPHSHDAVETLEAGKLQTLSDAIADDVTSIENNTSTPPSEPKPPRATPSGNVHEHRLKAPGLTPSEFHVTHDTTGQHTLGWDVAFSVNSDSQRSLPAGSCNLYLFPQFTPLDGEAVKPEPRVLEALCELIVACAMDPHCDMFSTPDVVGAFPIHALTVCNTEEALELVEQLCNARPLLLLGQLHTKHRAGFPLFTGESNLHVLCVNRREDLLCRLIQLAIVQMRAEHLKALLEAQCAGVFFEAPPMSIYGGTALSYACCFDLRRAVLLLLQTGLVSLNDRSQVDVVSGFLPLHAVVACESMETYDWLTTGLPPKYAALVDQRTSTGRLKGINNNGLTPVQLAARLGDHSAVKHILRKQCSINWVWGPVTEYRMSLAGIDSCGDGGGDVMELVARIDAVKPTTELLLDTFMTGFIYRLFLDKWSSYWRLHYARLLLDFMIMLMMLAVGFVLKSDPGLQGAMQPVVIVELLLMGIVTEEECRIAYLWWSNNQGTGDARLPWREMARNLNIFLRNHGVHMLFWSYVFNTISCVFVLVVDLQHPHEANASAVGNASVPTQGPSGRQLKAGGVVTVGAGDEDGTLGSLGGFVTLHDVGDESDLPAVVWLTLAMTSFLMFPYLMNSLFMPFERLNIFLLSMAKMMQRDLLVFLLLFGFFMFDFYIALFFLYPRAGTLSMPQVRDFNTWYSALQALFLLAFTGSPSNIDIEVDFTTLSNMQAFDFALWLFVYLMFTILSLILLLNLLIAMLSFTFESVRDESTLQCRTSFAQGIIRLELLADSFGMAYQVSLTLASAIG